MRHPLRARLLGALSERDASARDLADQFDVQLSNTAYHVRVLRDLGLIEVVAKEPVRGALKTTYRVVAGHGVDLEAWEELAAKARGAASTKAVQVAIDGVAGAIEAGTFDRRRDSQAVTLRMELDDEGWAEVMEIALEAQQRIRRAAEAAKRRAAEAAADTFQVAVSILGYESAERG